MKSHSQFVCQQCGYKSPSYLGKCPTCDSWNSFVETVEREATASWSAKNTRARDREAVAVSKLSSVKTVQVGRIATGISEVDQVLGGNQPGLVPGSLILLAGDPGIGKSTLTLQILSRVGGLYVSGEESAQQVKLRADRLKLSTDKISILPETNVEAIIDSVNAPSGGSYPLLIIDSIQTLWSEELTGAPGSVGQVRECTLKLLELAKKRHVSVMLVGHVTKEGTIAGPKVLEHIVDTVLYIEGDRFQQLRLLRSNKNRFGPVDEIGVFSMDEGGMREVKNPSEIFLGEVDGKKPASAKASASAEATADKSAGEAGRVIIATLEGTRPLLVEVQALTVATQIPVPRRVATGINPNRLQMLVAIIQKHLRLPLGNFDVFVNIASGLKVFEPAADLGVCLAIVSSFKNKPLPARTVAIGEVGLLGEIRNVIGLDRRIKEAKKLGFTHIISPHSAPSITEIAKRIL